MRISGGLGETTNGSNSSGNCNCSFWMRTGADASVFCFGWLLTMPSRPWYPFYPNDYYSKTKLLSEEEDLLYRRLLDELWINNGVLPKKSRSLAKLTRYDWRKFKRVFPQVSHYFVLTSEHLRHTRVDEEIAKTIKKTRHAQYAVSQRKDRNESTDVPTDVLTNGLPSQSQSQSDKKKIYKRKVFKKPTLEEVTAYCKERCNSINPQTFMDSNNAKGWVVGKTHTPMKDWQAAIHTWENNSKDQKKPKGKTGRALDVIKKYA